MPRRLLFLVVLALVVSACVDTNSAASTGDGAETSTTTVTAGDVSTTSQPSTTTTRPAPPVTEPDLSELTDLSAEVRDQLTDLIISAQEIRELPFLSPPNINVVGPEELEERVRESLEEVSDDIPADEALYKLFGLLDEEADLEMLLSDLYGEQVAGMYDGETGEIVVARREDLLSLVEQGTMIHELVHAIADQHFGFDPIYRSMLDEERLDEASAYQALIEGDASLAEVMWVLRLSQAALGEFLAESLAIDRSSLDAAPSFIQDSLIFPYDTGLAFVQDLYEDGGWDEVNQAYMILPDLPGSSEQVITPDDYMRDLPLSVDIPGVSLTGYQLERTSVWGEMGLRVMFDQVLGEGVSLDAAEGWGGDMYHQWFDGENAAFLMVYEGDTERDVEELRATLVDYALSAVAEEDFVWVDVEGGLLYFIAANEMTIGETIRSAVGLG